MTRAESAETLTARGESPTAFDRRGLGATLDFHRLIEPTVACVGCGYCESFGH